MTLLSLSLRLPSNEKLLGSEVAKCLVWANGVVDVFPGAELAVEVRHALSHRRPTGRWRQRVRCRVRAGLPGPPPTAVRAPAAVPETEWLRRARPSDPQRRVLRSNARSLSCRGCSCHEIGTAPDLYICFADMAFITPRDRRLDIRLTSNFRSRKARLEFDAAKGYPLHRIKDSCWLVTLRGRSAQPERNICAR